MRNTHQTAPCCWPCRTLKSTRKELCSFCSFTPWGCVAPQCFCLSLVLLSEWVEISPCVSVEWCSRAVVSFFPDELLRSLTRSWHSAVCRKTRRNCKWSSVDRLPMMSECLCFGLFLNHVTLLCLRPGEEYSPSYYPLKRDSTDVCLATGFSRYEENVNKTGFTGTTPARIQGDSLFNQLAFNSNCSDLSVAEGSDPCVDKLRPGVCWRRCDMTDC